MRVECPREKPRINGVRSKNIRSIVLLAVLLLVSSCGYRLSGTGGLVPEGTKLVAVPVFINGTNEPYVDVEVTRAVVQEFLTDGRLKVVSPEEAELVLHGKVTKYEVLPLSFTAYAHIQQYSVRLTVEASLEDLRTKKILWQEKGITSLFISDYSVAYTAPTATVPIGDATNISQTKISKEAAIQKASRDIAWTIRSLVLEGF
jgi:outer membrane lipopolysaccharide assembly protein LptE/RlpB